MVSLGNRNGTEMNDNDKDFDALTESQWLAMHWVSDYQAGLEKYRELVREWLYFAKGAK